MPRVTNVSFKQLIYNFKFFFLYMLTFEIQFSINKNDKNCAHFFKNLTLYLKYSPAKPRDAAVAYSARDIIEAKNQASLL